MHKNFNANSLIPARDVGCFDQSVGEEQVTIVDFLGWLVAFFEIEVVISKMPKGPQVYLCRTEK